MKDKNRHRQYDQPEKYRGPVHVTIASRLLISGKVNKFPYSAQNHQQTVGEVRCQEQEEVLVILGAETVVDEGAVVVVVIGAAIADCAVEWVFRLYYLIENAQVIQVYILLQKLVHKPNKVVFRLNVAWLHKDRQKESDQRTDENAHGKPCQELPANTQPLTEVHKSEPWCHQDYEVAQEADHDNCARSINFSYGAMSLKAWTLLVIR